MPSYVDDELKGENRVRGLHDACWPESLFLRCEEFS